MKRIGAAVFALILFFLITGCHLAGDPFTDSLADQRPVMTASQEGVLSVDYPDEFRSRGHSPREVEVADGSIPHFPLWFHDTTEQPAADDRFAWSRDDAIHAFASPARFVVSEILLPVHAVLDPPWKLMRSDGRSTIQKAVTKPSPEPDEGRNSKVESPDL